MAFLLQACRSYCRLTCSNMKLCRRCRRVDLLDKFDKGWSNCQTMICGCCGKIVEVSAFGTDGRRGRNLPVESTESTESLPRTCLELRQFPLMPHRGPQRRSMRRVWFMVFAFFFSGCIYQVATLACRHGKLLSPLSSCEVLSSWSCL